MGMIGVEWEAWVVLCVRQGEAGGRPSFCYRAGGECCGGGRYCEMWVGRLKSGPVLPVAQGAGLEVAVERRPTHSGFQEAGDLAPHCSWVVAVSQLFSAEVCLCSLCPGGPSALVISCLSVTAKVPLSKPQFLQRAGGHKPYFLLGEILHS